MEIEAIVKNGALVPLQPLKYVEGAKVRIIIVKEDSLRRYGKQRLIETGEDADELFEI